MAISQQVAKRTFLSAAAKSAFTTRNANIRAQVQREGLRQEFRRYAGNAPEVHLSPTPKPKRRFRTLRWLWRITYVSAIGGLVYAGYGVYLNRNPGEQPEPDPSKKTLVVLGKSLDGVESARSRSGGWKACSAY
jgi:NADH:ubiquinone reductase (non-electrogenic)